MGGASLRSNPGLPECECAVRPGYRSLSDSRLKLTAAGKCPLTSKLSLITKFFIFFLGFQCARTSYAVPFTKTPS